jgi:thiamine-phosphate pyrophosphorylase
LSVEAQLPRLLLIADGFTKPAMAAAALRAVEAGVRWIQFRDHAADEQSFLDAAVRLAERMHEVSDEVLCSVNTRLPVAARLGGSLHLGWRGPSLEEAHRLLGRRSFIGCSVHDEREAERAVRAGVHYMIASPVFPTKSKPDASPLGLEGLARVCRSSETTPVLALGGVRPDTVIVCRLAGAYGVAVLSGIMKASDSHAAARSYLLALLDHSEQTTGHRS